MFYGQRPLQYYRKIQTLSCEANVGIAFCSVPIGARYNFLYRLRELRLSSCCDAPFNWRKAVEQVIVGCWSLVVGSWQMTDDGWQMTGIPLWPVILNVVRDLRGCVSEILRCRSGWQMGEAWWIAYRLMKWGYMYSLLTIHYWRPTTNYHLSSIILLHSIPTVERSVATKAQSELQMLAS